MVTGKGPWAVAGPLTCPFAFPSSGSQGSRGQRGGMCLDPHPLPSLLGANHSTLKNTCQVYPWWCTTVPMIDFLLGVFVLGVLWLSGRAYVQGRREKTLR